ncbi:unnamed protein product (macronuclear) [Paramecium tetraurelia]|uniref:RNA cytidine acetyltransferase n=1 Tax=Paramecium tetraurelia TaxID=5888 RepID=A0EI22_PARTE|nr:uncharacterized protein GSPATT00027290001 [Paramecium tetraurelia]CAK94963.1 unnamed protein product [Paramecium tetraurelia]|eukprot:XP_001462336.1 hypothetical protein (macronuclear) [Paramecium tetraurelia strain d4-2]
MKKKLDSQIQALVQSGINEHIRSIFVMIGDRSKYQVATMHQLLSKLSMIQKPKVLWCYKKDLGFTTHKKKRETEIKNQQMKEETQLNEPFNLFLSSNEIRYCYYAETQKVLGNTYNMLILQDFEALTPNILCRTVETIAGGGIILFLIKTMSSLKQLYSLTMDIHSRLRTPSFKEVQPRFNERFIISLSRCQRCLFVDDELNLLPVSSTALEKIEQGTPINSNQVADFAQTVPNEIAQKLIKNCKTLDQAKIILGLIDSLQEKVFRYTISISAARGRGKSAAIGMAAAAALKLGFSNIFVTAPSPENLVTFFEFLISSLETLDFRQNQHFDVIQSTNPDFNNAVIRVNAYKTHRQFVQYIQPQDFVKVANNADLVFCDEAAAIPIQFVKSMFGSHTLVLSSTINGYEGTGRSLSLKLLQKLRETKQTGQARLLKELQMNDPIRYSNKDIVEKWLYELLLLDASDAPKLQKGLPHPNDCELYLCNRDTLFSSQKTSEKFLFNLMSLFISSHYKNSPNDLQLLSDAPAHAVFVLLGPLPTDKTMPDILCAVQVCFEGAIPKDLVDQVTNQQKPSGDLIPWTLSKYYLDNQFPQYSGVRVIRIATHPNAQKMGYGSKAMELLNRFCKGEILDPSAQLIHIDFREQATAEDEKDQLIQPKKKLPPLLKKLSEVYPPQIDYLGVSFGLTQELYKFWSKNQFSPAYLSLRKNDTTGEYTCIVLRPVKDEGSGIDNLCKAFSNDFRNRFINLLGYDFKDLEPYLCIDILKANVTTANVDEDIEIAKDDNIITKEELRQQLSLSDYARLENYCKSMADFYLILDILPSICKIFFAQKCGKAIRMSRTQAALLLGMGLQYKNIELASEQVDNAVNQSLPLFNKAMRKMRNFIKMVLDDEQHQRTKPKQQQQQPSKQSVIQQKRGKVNYQIDGQIDQEEIQQSLQTGDVVTLGRSKDQAYINYKKKVKLG